MPFVSAKSRQTAAVPGPTPHGRLTARRRSLVVFAVVILILVGGLLRFSPLWPGPSLPAGATPLVLDTEPAHLIPTLGCETALLMPARIAVEGDELVLVPEAGGNYERVVWPSGWAAWRLGGRAQLVNRDGQVVGSEGEVVTGFGGGVATDNRFHVCIIGD